MMNVLKFPKRLVKTVCSYFHIAKCKKKTYYIIGNYYKEDGLFSMFKHTIAHVIDAKLHGYIPVVDMRCYYNVYVKDGRAYKDNPWEYFFKQPKGIHPSDIKKSDNVIIATAPSPHNLQLFNQHLPLTKEDTRCHPYMHEYTHYLKFSPEIQKYLDNGLREKFGNERDILGIIVRGTDFVENKPKGHAIQPTAEMIIEKVHELKQTLSFKKIYLATEDASIYAKIKNEFKDMLIDYEQYRYETVNNKLINFNHIDRPNHFYNLAKEYLLSIYLLSKCRYLIGGRANGAIACCIATQNFKTYDYVYLWDLGVY